MRYVASLLLWTILLLFFIRKREGGHCHVNDSYNLKKILVKKKKNYDQLYSGYTTI